MLSSTSVATQFGGERATKQPVKLRSGFEGSAEAADIDMAIQTAYKHVYGNGHVMDCERSNSLEAELKDGRITVREFIRGLAKSDFYRKNFYDSCSPQRTIELDFKHLLGRPPHDQGEVSEAIQVQAAQGHDALVDSLIDSEEYNEAFGDHGIPFMRSWQSQPGSAQSAFNRTAAVSLGYAFSDKAIGTGSKLSTQLASGRASRIAFPASAAMQLMSASSRWRGNQPPRWASKVATVFVVAGVIEVTRLVITIAYSALSN
jgi:phycoerythrin-associated linker protein